MAVSQGKRRLKRCVFRWLRKTNSRLLFAPAIVIYAGDRNWACAWVHWVHRSLERASADSSCRGIDAGRLSELRTYARCLAWRCVAKWTDQRETTLTE